MAKGEPTNGTPPWRRADTFLVFCAGVEFTLSLWHRNWLLLVLGLILLTAHQLARISWRTGYWYGRVEESRWQSELRQRILGTIEHGDDK